MKSSLSHYTSYLSNNTEKESLITQDCYNSKLLVDQCCLNNHDHRCVSFKGETGSGKSSLINLILGEELLPYSILSTTSTICELKYGEERTIVTHYKDKDPETLLPTKTFNLVEPKASGKSYHDQIFPFVQSGREIGSVYKKVELFWPHKLLKVPLSSFVCISVWM